MEDKKDIIEFEDLFKEEIKERNKPPRPEERYNYIKGIFTYIIVMFFLAGLVMVWLRKIPGTQKIYQKDEMVLEYLIEDLSGLTLMDTATFEQYEDDYLGYVKSIGTYGTLSVVYHTSNPYIEDILLIKDANDELVFNPVNLEAILSDGEDRLAYWDAEKTIAITLYQHDEQVLPPTYLVSPDYMIEDQGVGLTYFWSAFAQFILMGVALAFLFLFLKNDIVYDFKEIKLIRNQWFMIIATGYLYIILGNIASNLISMLLSSALNFPPSEAANQLAIIRALNSNGVIFMILAAVIIGPIVEELVFRKSIFGLIKNDTVAVIVSALLFGAIHLTQESSVVEALVNGISYFVMGAIFGYIYVKNKRNIYAPIAVHMVVNLISVIAIFFM
ncbi:MAG: type II CAAX endopeptidase family protein [Acholeplasmataceae bacterium]|nr:CPBP family intramembrane metalloprotease [Acholeplasmataceae bacterium]